MTSPFGASSRTLLRLSAAAAFALATLATPAVAAPLGTNGAATPGLSWAPCGPELTDFDPDFLCATAQVPLDYRAPAGAKVGIALAKLPATGPGTKIGSVFVNPGGPGAPGRDAATFATANLRSRFDIVGFDPRGTGASNPIKCAASSEEALALLANPFPINAVQEATAATLAAKGAASCNKYGGPLLTHMSTANVARDLDLMRRAVGDAKLNFLGFSYGSVIGETYANLFPSTSRALVLDGVVDPVRFLTGRSSTEATQPLDYRAKSYVGTNDTITSFLNACAAHPDTCAFTAPGTTGAQLRTKFNAMLARVRSDNGVVVDLGYGDGPQTIRYQDVINMIYGELNVGILLSQDLARELDAIDLASTGATRIPSHDLRALFDALFRMHGGTAPDPSEPYDNFEDAFMVTICTDTVAPKPSAYTSYGRTANNEVAGFGPFWIYTTMPCGSWTARDADKYTGPWNARTPNPILLIGNKLGDPSVSYAGTATTAATLGNARQLSVNVYGHTAYGLTGTCVDDKVDAYFKTLAVPAAGTVCQPDFGPFDPQPEALVDAGADLGYHRGRMAHGA